MKTKSVPVLFTMFLVGLVALNGDAATDLVINEVSPVAPDGGHAWIELHNPTENPIPLSGLVFRTGEEPPNEVPQLDPEIVLAPGEFLVANLDADEGAEGIERLPSGELVYHAPATLTTDWSSLRGELALYRKVMDSGATYNSLIDYVAWGSAGEIVIDKTVGAVWPSLAFVPLSEGFGLFDPNTQIVEGASIGLYPGVLPHTRRLGSF